MSDEPIETGGAEVAAGSSGRQRRSRRHRRSGHDDGSLFGAVLRLDQNLLSRLVLAGLGLTLLLSAILFWYERTYYPQIWLSATHEDVRYGFGEPRVTRSADGREMWEYDIAEHTEFAMFENGRATTVGCAARAAPCPALLGASSRKYEDFLYSTFGVPDRQSVGNGAKTIGYDRIGIRFDLSRFKVNRITLSRKGRSLPSAVYRFALYMLP